MTANTDPIFGIGLDGGGLQFTLADTTTKKVLITGNTTNNDAGTLVESINICTTESGTVYLMFYRNDGSTDWFMGSVAVAGSSGYNGTPATEALLTLHPTLGFITVKEGHSIKVACSANMTSGKITDVTWQGKIY